MYMSLGTSEAREVWNRKKNEEEFHCNCEDSNRQKIKFLYGNDVILPFIVTLVVVVFCNDCPKAYYLRFSYRAVLMDWYLSEFYI